MSFITVVERLTGLLSLPVLMIRYVVPDDQTTLISLKTRPCGGHQRYHKVNADKNQIFCLLNDFNYGIASMFASTFKNIKKTSL